MPHYLIIASLIGNIFSFFTIFTPFSNLLNNKLEKPGLTTPNSIIELFLNSKYKGGLGKKTSLPLKVT
jgi:hypothetical protein